MQPALWGVVAQAYGKRHVEHAGVALLDSAGGGLPWRRGTLPPSVQMGKLRLPESASQLCRRSSGLDAHFPGTSSPGPSSPVLALIPAD